MLQFTRKLSSISLLNIRSILKYKPIYLFCNNSQTLNPTYTKIKQAFMQKGKSSQQYQMQMSRAMRQALSKYDYPQAINLELFHLSLIKQTDGPTSEHYRSELREITRFCINRLQFDTAAKLVEQLKEIESKLPDVGPLDIIATSYLQGYIYMEQNRLEESKKCLYQCLESKHVQEAPEVYFKVFSELARVHAKAGEMEQAYKKIQKCEEILNNRTFDPNAPPMLQVIDLQDVFLMAEIASTMGDKKLAEKHLDKYKQKMQKMSNMQDPMYVQFLERKSKIYFNLKEFKKAVQLLTEAAVMSEELGKTDPNFLQNGKIMRNIISSIEKQYINK